MRRVTSRFLDETFWLNENAKYSKPHFRLEKCSRILNRLARGKDCELLDIGCGPATLATLLDPNIKYHGIDIAIPKPSPNLLQLDFARGKIGFENKIFDLAVAAGVFEYMGDKQRTKLDEIRSLLKPDGTFVATYTNFHHLSNNSDYYPYNNVLPIKDFIADLQACFRIIKWFPAYHNRKVGMGPTKRWLQIINMHLNFNLPILSRLFAVSYFFICSPKKTAG